MRLIARVIVLVSTLFIVLYGVLPGLFRMEGDFISFYVLGRNLLHGTDPATFYKLPNFQRLVDASGLSTRISSAGGSTPSSFLINALLVIAPAGFSKFILTLVNLGALVLLVNVTAKLAKTSFNTSFLVFLSSSFALAANFSSGEPFIIVSLLLTTAFFAFSIGAERAAGTILGFLFPFEVFAAAPAILFLLVKKWKVFIYFVLLSVLLLLITYLVVGEKTITYYMQRVFPFYFNGKVENPYSIAYQTAWSFLRRTFLFDPTLNPHPVFASRNVYVFLISFFKAIVIVPSAYFFYRSAEKANARETFVAAVFPIVFLSPSAETFQLLLLAPAIVCLGKSAIEEQRPKTARILIVFYAAACLPVYGLFSTYLNMRTPFFLYERFFLLFGIYIIYLFYQLHFVPSHLIIVRMSITAAIIAAVAITLYIGDGTPEPGQSFGATPVLTGNELAGPAFSPIVNGNKVFYVGLDSTAGRYVVREESGEYPKSLKPDRDESGSVYGVSLDRDGNISVVEASKRNQSVVSFKTPLDERSYQGTACAISRDGDFGAFLHCGILYVVDLRNERIKLVDSVNTLPFIITSYGFFEVSNPSDLVKDKIVFVIDSLQETNSIGVYDLRSGTLVTYLAPFPVSSICADGGVFYMSIEQNDSTRVMAQRGTSPPANLFSVHGNVIDLSVVAGKLLFSSDYARGLNFPTVYEYTLKK